MWSLLKLYDSSYIRDIILKCLVISVVEDHESIDLPFAAGYYPLGVRRVTFGTNYGGWPAYVTTVAAFLKS